MSEPQKTPGAVLWLGKMIGLTQTQIDWRWRKLRGGKSGTRAANDGNSQPMNAVSASARPTQAVLCQWCRSAQSSEALDCLACGKKMISRLARSVRAMGLGIPAALSSTVMIATMCIVVYVMMLLAYPGSGFTSWKTTELLSHGALLHQDGFTNQPWRMATACVLHIGVLHLAMTLFSLAQIGPMVESIFGRGRTLFLFMFTGIIANVASLLLMQGSVSAGASGAIMGLMGVAAGVAHRLPESRGIAIRNHMLRWAGITMLMGFAIGADNAAHAGGFIAGGLAGVAMPAARVLQTSKSGTSAMLGAVGGLLLAVTTALALAKHPTPHYRDPRTIAIARYKQATELACQRLQRDPSASEQILLQYNQSATGKVRLAALEATCGFVATILPRCAAYQAQGVSALSDDERSAAHLEDILDYFNIWCAAPKTPL